MSMSKLGFVFASLALGLISQKSFAFDCGSVANGPTQVVPLAGWSAVNITKPKRIVTTAANGGVNVEVIGEGVAADGSSMSMMSLVFKVPNSSESDSTNRARTDSAKMCLDNARQALAMGKVFGIGEGTAADSSGNAAPTNFTFTNASNGNGNYCAFSLVLAGHNDQIRAPFICSIQ